jgi:hypothetical protein
VESCTATPDAHTDRNVDSHAKPPAQSSTYRLEGNEETKENSNGGVEIFWVESHIFGEVASLENSKSDVIRA